jgi:AraC-like DNA-binding protein
VAESEIKADIISSIGSMLTKGQEGQFTRTTDFGSFACSIEDFNQFAVVKRTFQTAGDAMTIPFSCHEPGIQMIFSLNGQSAFNDRFNPFLLSPVSHCLNFFKRYDCSNLLEENGRQQDVTFRLKKSFYGDFINNLLHVSEDRLPEMILHQTEFNTINEHLPADGAILGILKNILECPYTGEMKSVYIREHIRALLMLQLLHFNPIVSGKKLRQDNKISRRDEDVLHEVKQYIDQHFLEPASLESLSKHFGINEFKLKHGFKVLFETSPIRYLQYKRLDYAFHLLRDTDKTIKAIADEIGYAHAANFTAAFSKTFGSSPLQYRTERSERDALTVA